MGVGVLGEKSPGPQGTFCSLQCSFGFCLALPVSPPGTAINSRTKKWKTRAKKHIIEIEIVSKPQSRRKPQLVFWRRQAAVATPSPQASIVNLALCPAAGPCGLAPLQPAHTSSPPLLALGTMPAPPQAASHVAKPREQSRRTPERLGQGETGRPLLWVVLAGILSPVLCAHPQWSP